MNSKLTAFIRPGADSVAFFSAVFIGLAFFWLPWVGIGDSSATGWQLLTADDAIFSSNILDVSVPWLRGFVLAPDMLLPVIPVVALAGVVLTIPGIFVDSIRYFTRLLTLAAGMLAFIYFVTFFLANNIEIVNINIRLGFGFWLAFFTSITLMYQISLPDPPAEIAGVDLIIDLLRILIIAIIIAGASNTILSGKFTFESYVSLIVNGLAQGSIYALIALGYTLVYGILLMINFAHGEVFMAGAFTTMFLARYLDSTGFLDTYPIISIIFMIIFAGFISMIVAVLLERFAYRPLRGSPRLVPLITAIGASFFLQYTFAGLFGSGNFSYPDIDIDMGFDVVLAGYQVSDEILFVFLSALILMGLLYWLVERTKLGKAMRAVSEDKEVSRLMGIDIDLVILFTFAVGGALAGAAGVINGIFRPPGVKFTMGFIPGIKAFTAAVLGGIGNVQGAMLGGLFLGVIEALGPNLVLGGLGIPGATQLKDVIAFTMLVLVLIFRPQGIMGERLTEKKA